jgi:hypothetical protein
MRLVYIDGPGVGEGESCFPWSSGPNRSVQAAARAIA